MSAPYPIIRRTLAPLFKRRINQIEGLENLPADGRYIVCANHQSLLEAIFIKTLLVLATKNNVYFITQEWVWRFFKKIAGQKGLDWLGMIPKIYAEPGKSLDLAKDYLNKGNIIVFFPEGVRNPDNPFLLKGKTGAARLALWAKVPVVPIGYSGPATQTAWQGIKRFFFPRKKIRMVIGQPLYFNEYYKKEITKELLYEVTKKIMTAIGQLCGRSYPY